MFSAERKTSRHAGKPDGYDCSQRACGPSDTSLKQVKRLRLLPEPFAVRNLYFAQMTMLLLEG